MNPEIAAIVDEIRQKISIGLEKMDYQINHPDTKGEYKLLDDVPLQQIYSIYQKNGWIEHKKIKETKPRCRCTATFPNTMWRSDLHDCKRFPGKLMIILDDHSRFIVGWAYSIQHIHRRQPKFL